MAKLFKDRVWFNVSGTPGTGNVTVGSAYSGAPGPWLTPAQAGFANNDRFSYCIIDGSNFETGLAPYSTTGPSFSRIVTAAWNGSTLSTSPLTLTSAATVMCTPISDDANAIARPHITVLTSGTSFVANAASKFAIVTVIGAGGGSGGTGTVNKTAGAGAGAGLARKLYTLVPGQTYTYAVGAAGAAGANTGTSGTAGGAGGSSTFTDGTTLITGSGGTGGGRGDSSYPVQVAAGTGTNGDINITGEIGVALSAFSALFPCTQGGGSALGYAPNAYGVLTPGNVPGGGATPAAAATTSSAGAAGAQGWVIIEEYY